MSRKEKTNRYRVYVDGQPVQDFGDITAAIDYAARHVYLPWEKSKDAIELIQTGQTFRYCYGFMSADIEPYES